jgi:hypothetical protein
MQPRKKNSSTKATVRADARAARSTCATGAGFGQVVVYAVVPQVLTRTTGTAIYRLDANVRHSTIVETIHITTLGTAIAVVLSLPLALLSARNTTANGFTWALGRAILRYFRRVHPEFRFVAAFDIAPEKIGQTFDGCPCYPADSIETVLRGQPVSFGVIAVPAEAAQDVLEPPVEDMEGPAVEVLVVVLQHAPIGPHAQGLHGDGADVEAQGEPG